MKILGVIPARGGSKGIPQKNIKPLRGKPLIAYTIEAAQASSLTRVVVSTDSDEIRTVALQYGAEVLDRPSHLAQDSTPTLPVLQDVVERTGYAYDAVMTLQPTSPLRTTRHIDEAIALFSQDNAADSLVSVIQIPHNYSPEKIMTLNGTYLVGNTQIARRQDIPRYFARNGAAIYITRMNRIQSYILGGNILPYFMTKLESVDIDDLDDWTLAEKLLDR